MCEDGQCHMGLGRAPCHFLTPEVQRVNGPVLENPALCNTWRIWAPHCLGGSESPWQRGHPTHTHRTLSLLPVTPGPPQALPGLPHRNGELSMCLTLLCVCLQCPRHRGVTVRRLGPATTLLQEARCHLQGAASSRVSHPVTGERALYHVASAAGRCTVTGRGRVQAGGGCRLGVLHGHWPGEGAGQGSCTVTSRGRVQAGGGCRLGVLHGHWPGEGAGRGCCTVAGRGRVQAGGAARSLAGGGCRPGVLHSRWPGEGAAGGGCRPGELHGHWLGEGAGQGRVQAGGAAQSLAGGGCRPGKLHGHWPGEGAGRGSCTVTGRGRVQVGVLEGPGCGCDSFPGGLENVLMPQKGDRARRALGQPERNLDTGLWA
ncbi:unnamed protein product [Natator depressus]